MINTSNDKNTHNIKFAYLHSMSFPNNEANAFDAVWTASAMADQVDTTLIVKQVSASKSALVNYYYIPGSKLRFQSMHLNRVPDRLLIKLENYYEKTACAFLRYHPAWAFHTGIKVIYAREPKLLRYFGLLREKQAWLDDWILVYESHDPLGYDPNQFKDDHPFKADPGILKAAANFDVFICNTKALAEDLQLWSEGVLSPQVITLASPLQRLEQPPKITFGKTITLGYIGTIDTYRGVDILIQSLRHLPGRIRLRVIGRFRREDGVDPGWLEMLTQDPQIAPKLELQIVEHIDNVQTEIDRCDILVQPASHDINDARYATPQKAFGYMVRGKPILAGDVPCHRELFSDGQHALFYPLTPKGLAQRAIDLAERPDLGGKIAYGAWEKSTAFTYTRRAEDILSLVRCSIKPKS